MIILNTPKFEGDDDKVRLVSEISVNGEAKKLWFEVDAEFKDIIADDTLDSFVVAVLALAMTSGQDINVQGTLSSKLYYNLTHYLIPILSIYFKCDRISINASNLIKFSENVKIGSITGFSGGIDSFCNYYDHSGDRASEEFKISHFLYNNVGSHGQHSSDEDHDIFVERLTLMKRFAAEEKIQFIPVNSNMDEIVDGNFQKTHTLRNASVALLTQKSISNFYYASGYSFADTKIGPSHDTASMDPVILPLLSTERMSCVPTGGQHSRVNKTHLVSQLPASQKYLDVCVAPKIAPKGYINCAVCWKCMRTEITLMLQGSLENYTEVFPIEDFKKLKNLYLVHVYSIKDPLAKEIINLINEIGYKVPVMVRIMAFLMPRIVSKQMVKIFPWVNKNLFAAKVINLFLRF